MYIEDGERAGGREREKERGGPYKCFCASAIARYVGTFLT